MRPIRGLPGLLLLVSLVSIACGRPSDGGGGGGGDGTPRTNDSPVCAKAKRQRFGAAAQCIETPLPDLDTPAGKVVRVHDAKDPAAHILYALVPPSGEPIVESRETLIETISKAAGLDKDPKALPPEKIAALGATLLTRSALVRCLPGTNDTLPGGAACEAPAWGTSKEGVPVVTAIIERFPDRTSYEFGVDDDHELWRTSFEIDAEGIDRGGGERIAELPKGERPAILPPEPFLATPADTLAKPVEADETTRAAVCELAKGVISELGVCKVWEYPSLDTPAGRIVWVANDVGQLELYGRKKPDGSWIVGTLLSSEVEEDVLESLWSDPQTPADKLLTTWLFFAGTPARIRCLTADDKLPGGKTCEPPKLTKRAEDQIVIDAIIERLPLRHPLFSPTPHDISRVRYTLTPGGGMLAETGAGSVIKKLD